MYVVIVTTPAYAEGDTPYELSKYLMGKIIEYKPTGEIGGTSNLNTEGMSLRIG